MSKRWKIGVLADCLGIGVREGVRKAADLGADGVQVYVTKGEMFPDNLLPEQRRDFGKFTAGLGLEISALCADFDWVRGFTDAEFNRENIPRIKKCLDLAADLETGVVTMHIGRLPDNRSHPVYQEVIRTSVELGEYAAARGVCLCTETGPEPPARLLEFLQELPTRGIGVNYDPANLVMCGPFDHIGGVSLLKDYIRHTHAKDGVCLGNGRFQELPLGHGGVVFPYYLSALAAAGYDGYLTIEREDGDDRLGDVARAVGFLRESQARALPALPSDE